MDYEKMYKESLERAKNVLNGKATDREPSTSIPEYIFPELAESEDERIRKELAALVIWASAYSASGISDVESKEMLAWLEKRRELQWKPSEEQMKQLKSAANIYPDSRLGYALRSLYQDLTTYQNNLKDYNYERTINGRKSKIL